MTSNGGYPSKLPGWIDPRACIGMPPEHRDYRWRSLDASDELSFYFPVIAESAIVEAFCSIDGGLDRPTTVGEFCYLMKHAHIGHDAQLGANCNVAPGAIVGGHVTIGDGVKIGLGASLRPRVTVGDGAVIGAGAVVVRDVPAGEVWAGNPAGRLRDHTSYAPDDWPDRDAWMEWYDSWHK